MFAVADICSAAYPRGGNCDTPVRPDVDFCVLALTSIPMVSAILLEELVVTCEAYICFTVIVTDKFKKSWEKYLEIHRRNQQY